MRKFITKRTAVLAVLLVAAGAAYAECAKCYCFKVGDNRYCFCVGCENTN